MHTPLAFRFAHAAANALRACALASALTGSLAGCAAVRPTPAGPPEAAVHEQAVRIPAQDLGLTGVLFSPASSPLLPERRPAIVLMHGCGGMVDSRGELVARHRDWAERFARWGFVALTLDSFSPRGIRAICELKERPIHPWKERTADAYAALRYLAARADVDPGAIFVLGWSHGGSTVTGVVRPQATGREPSGPQFKAAVAFYPGCERPLGSKSYRTTMPLLILHGEADDWTPAAPCVELGQKLQAAGQPVKTITYAGAHHGFDQPVAGIRFLPKVYNPRMPGEQGAHVGQHPQARLEAIDEVRRFVTPLLRRSGS